MSEPQAAPAVSLLDLPDKALLAVLGCLAADSLTSLFSAASAHSTLHQLSAAALTSIDVAATQQRGASLQLYLSRHGQHVNSLALDAAHIQRSANSGWDLPLLDELPPGLQLQQLSMLFLRLQLLPGGGRAGMLPPGAPIKQLKITYCTVSDTPPGAALEQALSQLPQLEHLTYANWSGAPPFPGRVLSHLQQLTSLNVMHAKVGVLEYVDFVPGLLDLKANCTGDGTSTKLAALQQLTSLVLFGAPRNLIHPASFANKSQLQHLQIKGATLAGGPAGVSALLSQLQQMTQLTDLSLQSCWDSLDAPYDPSGSPAAAYAALTASSTLQHLAVSGNPMPEGIWRHVLPADRQLPQLRVLNTSYCGALGCWTRADTARLASCCPNLQKLEMHTNQPLAAQVLQPLRSLTALTVLDAGELDDAWFAATAELMQLRQLEVYAKKGQATDAGLLQLTQLKQLVRLAAHMPDGCTVSFSDKVNEPVWRQVLQLHEVPADRRGIAGTAGGRQP